jgi:DNA-binding ferritin-like protein
MLDEQGDRIFATTDDIAERVRKIGGTTLRSIGQISRLQRILDNDAEYVTPLDMLAELRDDNKQLCGMQFSGQVKEEPPAAKSTATRRSTRSDASADNRS